MRSNVEQEKRFYKNRRFSGFHGFSGALARFSIKDDDFGFDILLLVFLKPAETSLMLWLHGNGFIKRVALFGSCRHISQTQAKVEMMMEFIAIW